MVAISIICIYWLWPNGFNKHHLPRTILVQHGLCSSVWIKSNNSTFGSFTMQLRGGQSTRMKAKNKAKFNSTMQRMKIKSQDFEDKCAWNIINHIEFRSFARTMYAILICERILNIILSFFCSVGPTKILETMVLEVMCIRITNCKRIWIHFYFSFCFVCLCIFPYTTRDGK